MGLIRRVRALFQGDKLGAELDEELRFHLAMREEMNANRGMPPEEAHWDARRRFGNATQLKESMREIDLLTFLESVGQGVRFAIRMLMKQPGFTAAAVLALAVGIAVNTAAFTAYKAAMFQGLDAKNPRQLVNIYRTSFQERYGVAFSYPDYEIYRDRNRVFTGLVATMTDELTLSGEGGAGGGSATGGGIASAFGFRFPRLMAGGAEFVSSAIISENYFSVLGVNAIRGRVFLLRDGRDLDAHPGVLISENYWQRRFGGDPKVLGKTVKLNGAAFAVIGVTPRNFMGTIENVPDFWVPIRLYRLLHHDSDILHDREDHSCRLYGRLAPGVTLNAAQAEMNLLTDQVRRLHIRRSDDRKPVTINLLPGSPFDIVNVSGEAFAFLLILCAVALVLPIACANVASLQLGRSAARQREIGVRLSLGASRFRLIRQLLTESALLGLLAGAVGLVISWWLMRILVVEISAALPIEWGSLAVHVEPDVHVFAYVFAVSLLAGVLFGLAPALESSSPSLSSVLKEEGARFAFRVGSARLRDLLVTIQVCVCLFLLIAAGLLIRGSIRSVAINPGYETKRVVGMDVNFPAGFGYTHQKQDTEVRQLRDRIRSLPGVRSITAGRQPAGGGLRTAAVTLNGLRPGNNSQARTLFYNFVAANYFETLSIPLTLGRGFDQQTAIVLSESAAHQFWPSANPVGQSMVLDASGQYHGKDELIPRGISYRVIGIAKDIRGALPGGADSSMAYLPLPFDSWDDQPLLVRIEGDPKSVMDGIGRQVHSVDPNLVVYAETLDDLLTATPVFVFSRLAAVFASIIGTLGLALASVGIYGAVSYAVVRRMREIGIRMALGAKRSDVLSLILRESTRPVLIGLLAGLIAAAVASRVLRSLLFGLSTLDGISFLGISTFFLIIALLAAYMPARRAMRVDPMVALRYE